MEVFSVNSLQVAHFPIKSKTQKIQPTRRKGLLQFYQITIITKQTMDVLWTWF